MLTKHRFVPLVGTMRLATATYNQFGQIIKRSLRCRKIYLKTYFCQFLYTNRQKKPNVRTMQACELQLIVLFLLSLARESAMG